MESRVYGIGARVEGSWFGVQFSLFEGGLH